MRIRVIKRYSECFKRQVVEELENGRFASIKRYDRCGGSIAQFEHRAKR